MVGGFLAGGVALLIYAARDNKQLRQTLGILWDVMSFFPRRFHPLAPPCYAERAVVDVRNRLIHMTTHGKDLTEIRDSNVVLVAHSEGSLISTAALLSLMPENIKEPPKDENGKALITPHPGHPQPTGQELRHLAFVTYGCMLARLYIDALLIDEEAADAVWEAWDRGELTTYDARWAWLRIASLPADPAR